MRGRCRWPSLLLAAAALLSLASLAQAASFQVSPERFEFPLTARYTNFFTVTNNSDERVRIRIYPEYVIVNDKSQLVTLTGQGNDLSQFVVLNPRRVTLEPQEKRVVRFSVRPPEAAAEGEYYTVIFFEELPPPPEEGRAKVKGLELKLQLLTRLGVSLYGSLGEKQVKMSFSPGSTSEAQNKLIYTGQIVNDGNTHLVASVGAALLNSKGLPERNWEGSIVLQRGQRRDLVLQWDRPPPGVYSLHLTASSPGLTPIESSFPVTVAPRVGN